MTSDLPSDFPFHLARIKTIDERQIFSRILYIVVRYLLVIPEAEFWSRSHHAARSICNECGYELDNGRICHRPYPHTIGQTASGRGGKAIFHIYMYDV